MTKPKTATQNPTPAQARILNAMKTQEGKVSIWYGNKNTSKPTAFGFLSMIEPQPKVRIESIMVCVQKKWLVDETIERSHRGNRITHRVMELSDQGEHALAMMPEDHLKIPTSGFALTVGILDALAKRYAQPEWAFFDELSTRTGHASQRVDAWAMHCWPSSKYERISFEIKVSRSDWIKELNNPIKREHAKTIANKFYFVCPAGMIKPDEVPPDTGLIWWHPKTESLGGKVIAPDLEHNYVPTWGFVASIARRYARIRYPTETVSTETVEGSEI